MSEIILKHSYDGSVISQRNDGMVNLTDMAKSQGKRVGNYLRLDSTKEYVKALSADTQIRATALIQVFQGGNGIQGTWAHPEIAIDFASWCNVQFRIWANRTLRGEIEKTRNIEPIQPVAIAPVIEAEKWTNVFTTLGLDKSPRHLQLVQDKIANLLSDNALPPADEPKWQGVAEIAESLGYEAYAVSKYRSHLGRMAAAWYRGETDKEPETEERIVNGRTCSVKVYRPSEELEAVITAYLDSKLD